ncbi:MAG: hypothetical protein IT572_01555 [Deltaproteobacteria bacterium]|nr:hypothetical protein [Deltaproteobacteria bacterium]
MKKLVTLLFLGITLSLGVFARPALAGTGVFVNGRSLSVSQLIAVSRALDYVPAPGYYWYDPRSGNYGRVGGSGGGDRFWSTSFSAGNSTADNSQGYVSVPGYGPVSYGM